MALWLTSCAALAVIPAVAQEAKNGFRFATSFGNHMVLQAGKPAIVWGWCTSQVSDSEYAVIKSYKTS